MSAALVDDAVLAIVQDPLHQLTGAERTLLRKLGRAGPALSLGFNKGWILDGTRYTGRALQRFLDLKLARFWKDADGVKLGLNDMGALAAWKITPSKPGSEEASPDD